MAKTKSLENSVVLNIKYLGDGKNKVTDLSFVDDSDQLLDLEETDADAIKDALVNGRLIVKITF